MGTPKTVFCEQVELQRQQDSVPTPWHTGRCVQPTYSAVVQILEDDLARLLRDKARLLEEVTELQRRGSELVMQNRVLKKQVDELILLQGKRQ